MHCNALGSFCGSFCEFCFVNRFCDCSKHSVVIVAHSENPDHQEEIGEIIRQARQQGGLLQAIQQIEALPSHPQINPIRIQIRNDDNVRLSKEEIGAALVEISRQSLRQLQTDTLFESYRRLIGAALLSGIDLEHQFVESIALTPEKHKKLLLKVEEVRVYGSQAVLAWQLVVEKTLDEIKNIRQISKKQIKILSQAFKQEEFALLIDKNRFSEIPTHSKKIFMDLAKLFPKSVFLPEFKGWTHERKPNTVKPITSQESVITSSNSLSNSRGSSSADSGNSSPGKIEEEFKKLFLSVNKITGQNIEAPKTKLGFLRLELLCCLLEIDPENLKNETLSYREMRKLNHHKDRLLKIDGAIVHVCLAIRKTKDSIELENTYGFPLKATQFLGSDRKRFRQFHQNLLTASTLSQLSLPDLHFLAQVAEEFTSLQKEELALRYKLEDWLIQNQGDPQPLHQAPPRLETLDLDYKTP